ncbi:MAG: DUF4476 domain-containing protein, partial [Myxococcales bacterium]|nr:DUF4476 domain-containing protein [Myxococcales bacterium]
KGGYKKHNQKPQSTETTGPELSTEINKSLQTLRFEVAGINAIVDNPVDDDERRSIQNRLHVIDGETRRLERLIQRYLEVTMDAAPTPVMVQLPVEPQPVLIVQEPTPPSPLPMPAGDFAEMIGQMRNASFSSDQMTILQTAIGGHYLNTDQASAIIGVFSFSSDKLAAAEIAVPRLIDPNQAFHLLKLMDFSSDKDKLKQIIDNVNRTRK